MRPEILLPLFQDVITLTGVGPRVAGALEKLSGRRVVDVCWLLPHGLINRRRRPSLALLQAGETATLQVEVVAHRPPRQRHRSPRQAGQPYLVHCRDDSGLLDLVFFRPRVNYLLERLPAGAVRLVSGQVDFYRNQAQMHHPDYMVEPGKEAQIPLLEAVYPSALGVAPRLLRKTIAAALQQVPDLPEWCDPQRRRAHGWPGWREALGRVHAPQTPADLEPTAPARMRLAYDELLASQLTLAFVRARQAKKRGRAFAGGDDMQARCRQSLPYALTAAQRRVVAEINADMAAPHPMLRLLQGDVGSGKTIVAFLAMLRAVASGAQAAFMAPTELLARQQHAYFKPLCEALGLQADLLIGRSRLAGDAAALQALEQGRTNILVGTHALFQERVQFHDLGLVVIDEQHRFGVHQKLQLSSKGKADVDMLVMTATPIPRTLTMTVYGYMEVSRLDESPPGRLPIATRVLPLTRLEEVAQRLQSAIADGGRAYWVCPLVEESESDMQHRFGFSETGGEPQRAPKHGKRSAARERYIWLRERFGERVGLVHGRMKGKEKDAVMQAFQSGRLDVLVATTVVEVGIDVPDAGIMVIEQAEQFGLAQLHQLRGRVGRGQARSSCLLLYREPLSEMAARRLQLLRETEDGFQIAEEDLRLRGPGELLGTRQSGAPDFRLAHPWAHQALLPEALEEAKSILADNPKLEGERGEALRVLLYLFERDEAIRYFRSG